jgi:hypothetical protein
MVRIAISRAAFDAIAATMAFGSVNYEAKRTDKGEVFIWLDEGRGQPSRDAARPGESYSDVILRMATAERE